MKKPFLPIALTVDVEGSPERLPHRMDLLLNFFADRGIGATFFFLGEAAKAQPTLVAKVAAAGHEVGFHGARHVPLFEIAPAQLRAELADWRRRLEDLAQAPVRGYRAPYFSLVPQTAWALPLLAEAGFGYDGSIHPGWHPVGGWWGAPRSPAILDSTNLVVWPVPIFSPLIPLTFSGGVALRFLHSKILRWSWCHGCSGSHGMIYLHPWETEPDSAAPVSTQPPNSGGFVQRWRWERLTGQMGRRHLLKKMEHLLGSLTGPVRPMGEIITGLSALPRWNPARSLARHTGVENYEKGCSK